MKNKDPIKSRCCQMPLVPIMRCLARVISSVIPSIKPVKDDVEGTNVRFATRLSALYMGLHIIDSMIDAQFLMKLGFDA